MDARQLRFFLAVIDHQGFSKAAEQLYIAQPSLSQAIAVLERELGVSLFHRVGRGVVPTDAGKARRPRHRRRLRPRRPVQRGMRLTWPPCSGNAPIRRRRIPDPAGSADRVIVQI